MFVYCLLLRTVWTITKHIGPHSGHIETILVCDGSLLPRIGVHLAGILRGRMASTEGGSVPNGVGVWWGLSPLQPTRKSGERRELPQRGPGRAHAENGFWRILKATERSFLYLYDKNLRGTICTSAPYSKFWGTCPRVPPVIYAHTCLCIYTWHFAISCLRTGRKIVKLCLSHGRRRLRSSDIDTCLVQRTNTRLGDRSYAAAGPQPANPAARVGHYARKISVTQNASICLLTAEWQFFVRCV